jgi:hypothetical protein
MGTLLKPDLHFVHIKMDSRTYVLVKSIRLNWLKSGSRWLSYIPAAGLLSPQEKLTCRISRSYKLESWKDSWISTDIRYFCE